MNEQLKELFDTLCFNYDFPEEFAKGLAEFLYEEDYRKLKRGKWGFKKWAGQEYYKCSCCSKDYPLPPTWTAYDINKYLKYCSACGAKMTEE